MNERKVCRCTASPFPLDLKPILKQSCAFNYDVDGYSEYSPTVHILESYVELFSSADMNNGLRVTASFQLTVYCIHVLAECRLPFQDDGPRTRVYSDDIDDIEEGDTVSVELDTPIPVRAVLVCLPLVSFNGVNDAVRQRAKFGVARSLDTLKVGTKPRARA